MGFKETNIREYMGQRHIILALIAILLIVAAALYTGLQRIVQIKLTSGYDTYYACKLFVDDDNLCRFADISQSRSSTNVTINTITNTKDELNIRTEKLEIETTERMRSIVFDKDNVVESYILYDDMVYVLDLVNDTWVGYQDRDFVKLGETDSPYYDFESVNSSDVVEFNEQYTFSGTEPCGDKTCFRYNITDKEDSNLQTQIWFDTDNFLLQRMLVSDGESTIDSNYTYGNIEIMQPAEFKKITEEEIEEYL